MNNFASKSLEGTWWIPSVSRKKYSGTLNLDNRNHGRLILHGKQTDLIKLWPPKEKSVTIHGLLKNKYEYEVSLFNAGMMQGPALNINAQTNRNSKTTVEYYTNNVLIGDHLKDENTPYLNAAIVLLTGLEQWCDDTGLSGEMKNDDPSEFGNTHISLKYKPKRTRHFDLGKGRSIRFISQYTGPLVFPPHIKKALIEERNAIEIAFNPKISIRTLLDELHIWQTFIALGLRRPCRIDKIHVFFPTPNRNFVCTELIVPGKVPEDRVTDSQTAPTLFTKTKLSNKLGKCVRGWRNAHDTLAVPILLFSGTTYQETSYSHANTLTYLQAIEVLHREKYDGDQFPTASIRKAVMKALRNAIPKNLDANFQKELANQISFVGSPTLLDRLLQLYDIHREVLSPLFPDREKDMKELKDVRNYLTHYGQHKTLTPNFPC